MTIEPADLIAVADLCRETFEARIHADWERKAANVDWTCRQTLAHMCGVGYSLDLATRSAERHGRALAPKPDASIESLVITIHDAAMLLVEVVRAAPADARGYHTAGMADAEGFLAMEIDEDLIHTADIAAGLGVSFDPPIDIVRRLLDRLFPWWPVDEEPWSALLWANGRGELPGHPNPRETWLWHCRPLAEWDGTVPRWDPVSNRAVSS